MAGNEVHIPPESDDFMPKTIIEHLSTRKNSWLIQTDHLVKRYTNSQLRNYWEVASEELKEHLLLTPIHQQNLYTKIWSLHAMHKAKFNESALVLGDKTPLNSESPFWLNKVSPNSKFIFLLRNVFDTVASRKTAFDESIPSAFKRYANTWKSMSKFKRQHGELVRQVFYEDLVNSPSETMQSICDFLGLTYSDKMLSADELPHGDGDLAHHAELYKRINTSAIGKGALSLNEQEILQITKWSKKIGLPSQLYKH